MDRSLAVVLILGLVAAACGPQAPSGAQQATAAPAASAAETPVAGGRIVDGATSDIKTLQPVLSTETASSDVWSLIYIGLTRNDPEKGKTVPRLAEKFEFLDNSKTLKYTLRDGLTWSDGVAFTGEDYKYTAEATMRSKKTIRKGNLENIVGAKEYGEGKADTIKGIEVGDGGKTVTIRFTNVFCPALDRLSGGGPTGIIPRHHFIKYFDPRTTDVSKNIDDNPLNLKPPAAMGPFTFKEHVPGVSVTLAKNPKYYLGAPLVDEYMFKFYADSTAIKAALLTGEVTYSGVSPKDYDDASKAPNLKGFRFQSLSNNYIGWMPVSQRAPWLANKQVRQALMYGLNIDQVVEKVLFGFGRRVYAHTVPAQWAYSEEGFNKYPYDPARAKQLLEQAGAKMGPDGVYRWTDGRPMRMQIETNSGNTERETIVQIAQEQYGQIGIRIDPLLESFPALTERLRPGKTDVDGWIIGAALGTDPDPFTFWHSTQGTGTGLNRVQWNKSDAFIDANRNGPDCSEATRAKAIHEFNKQLNEEVPWTFMYVPDSLVFANKALQDFDPKPFSTGSGWNIEKWWIKR